MRNPDAYARIRAKNCSAPETSVALALSYLPILHFSSAIRRIQLRPIVPRNRAVVRGNRASVPGTRQLFHEIRRLFHRTRQLFSETGKLLPGAEQLFPGTGQLFPGTEQLFSRERKVVPQNRAVVPQDKCNCSMGPGNCFPEQVQLFHRTQHLSFFFFLLCLSPQTEKQLNRTLSKDRSN